MTFARKDIKERRERLGLSQGALGKLAGNIAQQTVSAVENGDYTQGPRDSTIVLLLAALDRREKIGDNVVAGENPAKSLDSAPTSTIDDSKGEPGVGGEQETTKMTVDDALARTERSLGRMTRQFHDSQDRVAELLVKLREAEDRADKAERQLKAVNK